MARYYSSFKADGLCRYTNTAEFIVRQNQKRRKYWGFKLSCRYEVFLELNIYCVVALKLSDHPLLGDRHLNSSFSRRLRGEVDIYMRSAGAYMMVLGIQWKGGRERMLCRLLYQQIKRLLEHKVTARQVCSSLDFSIPSLRSPDGSRMSGV